MIDLVACTLNTIPISLDGVSDPKCLLISSITLKTCAVFINDITKKKKRKKKLSVSNLLCGRIALYLWECAKVIANIFITIE